MKPNDKFKLTVRDVELIELALQGKISRRAMSVSMDPSSVYAKELQDEITEIRDLLGRIHNQKVWYRPKDGRFSPGRKANGM
jgi:hypothetical protein|tara:strand:+ start:4292 stop:4537 length:246 start_codon:yes stop_codon:yes gene_type:complete